MFVEFFKKPDRIHACASVATLQQRERWTRHPPGVVFTYPEDIDSDDQDSFMQPLIHMYYSNNKEDGNGDSPRKYLYSETTRDTVHPSEIYIKEPTSAHSPGTSLEPSVPTREDNKGSLDLGDIMKYPKGSDLPIFATLEECTKESPWGDTWNICILGKDQWLKAGEDLLTPTEIPSKIPINLEEVEKDMIISNLTREDMAKLCSTGYLLVQYEREILVWHHRLNQCSLKSLLRLYSRVIITNNLSKVKKLPPVWNHRVLKASAWADLSGNLPIPDQDP